MSSFNVANKKARNMCNEKINNFNNRDCYDTRLVIEESSFKSGMSKEDKTRVGERSCLDTIKQVVPEKDNKSLYLVSQPLERIRLNKPFNLKDMWKQGSDNLAEKTNGHKITDNNGINRDAQLLQGSYNSLIRIHNIFFYKIRIFISGVTLLIS